MTRIFTKSIACAALFFFTFPRSGQSEVIIQYFETRWDEMYQRLPEIAEIGYESIWTPPPGKSPIGGPYPFAYGGNVGYNSFDRFDLGDQPQRGNWETRYGSRTSLRNLVDNAHQSDIKIYPDIVFNHTGNGPDFRTYPGMVPQDFHVWADATQPGGFKRADRMWQWDPANGTGGTLHQELVSLMDIVLEFDKRFQVGGANSVGYAADPAPFVRHPGDYEKYPYNPTGTLPNENSRDFMIRWINWLGYAMDYDGVRLDAPKHVAKEFFGLPKDTQNYTNSFIYNIQKNFNERRGFSDTNLYDDMYANDIRRDDAMVFSEFFVGSIGEVDYWRNPADRGWGIQSRYLNFPLKSGMMRDAFNNGNLGTLAALGVSFDPTEAINFVQSHDEAPLNKLELAHAYLLTHVGVPVVYFSGNNLKDSEIGRAYGKNTWMNKGYDGALGDFGLGAIPNLVYIHNQFARGNEFTRWGENDFFAFERYADTNNNGSPDSGEGLLLVVLNDSGSDQTRNGIQTSFAPGTALKDYTGKNLNTVYVDNSGKVNITVGGWWGQGYGCWAPYNADGPATGSAIQFSGTGVGTMSWVVPGGRDAAAKPRTITRLSGNSVTIDVRFRNPALGGEAANNVLVKWGQGRNLNTSATDFSGKDPVNSGYEQANFVADGQYRLVADLTGVPEGLHTIKARVFNGRTGNKPALFQTFTTTVYVDRRGPDLEFENLNANETIEGARVITVNNPDRTLYNLTYKIDGGADQQADMVIRGKWRIALDGLSNGQHTITLNATEADYGASRAVINSTTLSRTFNVDTAGSSITINHASGAILSEPFFKTTVTVPAGTATNNVKLFWNGYEQIYGPNDTGLRETAPGSGVFEIFFNGRYRQGGVNKLFTGAFVNGPNFFEAVVNAGTANENRVARRVVFNLFGQNMQDSDGDGVPDDIELTDFLSGKNPGPDQAWPGDSNLDLIPNFGESWSRLNAMAADTYYNGAWDGDRDTDGDGTSNLQEVIKGFRISGNPYAYNVYNASSVPPATVGSFATSALSMSNGNKIVTITYRPNDGPLANASAVTVNLTPVGGGSPQSVAMAGGPTEFTYSYAVPSNTTVVNYTFTSGGTSDSTGGATWSASTTAAFVMDGLFDSENFIVSDSGMRIYAAIRGNKLYTATWSPKGGNNDHVIYITDQFGNPVTAGPATASDSASSYTTWANGSNQGSGFGAWSISTGGTVSGVFLGDPAAAGIQGMGSKSFGLYAKGGSGSSVQVYRTLTTPLAVGDSLAFQWSINWESGAGGEKGFNIRAGSTFLLNVKNQNDARIFVADVDSGMVYGSQAMNWSITRTADNVLRVRATTRDGKSVFSRDVTVSAAAPSQIEFYAQNLTGDDQRQPYFNDLRIYRNGASAKGGLVYGTFNGSDTSEPWVFSTPSIASQYGFKSSGRNWLGNSGQALEAELDLVDVFGSVPKTLFIAVGAYSGGFGGTLLSQAPARFGNSDADIEIPEFQPIATASIRDEDLDGKFDVGTPEMLVSVNGNETDGNYGLRRFYLDEVAGDTASLTVRFKPNATGTVSNVEVFTNLNRRDYAKIEEDPATVTTSTSSTTYFRAYAMSGPDASGYYTASLPVELCGAYRLQVRYKVAGVNSGNYLYYTDNAQRRDCAIVVSPKKALTLNMYEVNPLIVEAKDATKAGRSTFQDLIEGGVNGINRFGGPDALNQGHYSSMGINMIWLQPIHPIGIEGRDTDPSTGSAFDPGSPYAVRDYWSVAPMLGRSDTNEGALSEFQAFVSSLDDWGVGVMMDGTFNHSAPDAIMGQGAVDLGITGTSSVQIRDFNPGWYAKEGFPATPASNTSEIAIAPDRNDFGNWTDVREFYFGDYDALVKEKGTQNADKSYPDNAYKLAFLLERDEFAGHTATTRKVWDYFAYYPIYWLNKTGNTNNTPKNQSYKGIDGLRCDFAQGLPSQFWEYAINKTRARKWDFIFMAESLDGARTVGNSSRHGVGYRSARHFDVLNENIVFYWRDTFFGYPANGGAGTPKGPKTYDTFKAYDDRRNAFDNVTLLNNLTSHDEVFPHNDVWAIAYGYAQVGALDGIPMLMYGQEAGAQNSASAYSASVAKFGNISSGNNFAKYEANFGKNIPNFKVYNNMASIWTNRTGDEWKLQNFYGRVNKARLAAPALQSQNAYFLSKKQTNGGYDDNLYAVGKVQNLGQTGGGTGNSVVFAFVNNNYRSNATVAATFDLNAKVPGSDLNYFGIERGRNYNIKDLLADNATAYVWTNNRTGADLIDNGLYVGLPNTNTATGSYQAQYLQLVDVSSPNLSFVPPQYMTYGTTNNLTNSTTTTPASTVTYSLLSGDTNKVSLSGNQLIINSGTGSVVVRATVAATADRGGATADATITFQKATQTITFDPRSTTGSTSEPARTLIATSSSGLAVTLTSENPEVASLSSGNSLNFNSPGSAVITASQAGNDNYEAATSVSQTYTVSSPPQSFEDLFPNQTHTSDINGDGVPALLEYMFNGSTNSNNLGILPQLTPLSNNTLKLVAVVRTNPTNFTIRPQFTTNLDTNSNNWSTNQITNRPASDQSGVPTNFVRREFIFTNSNNSPRAFLRLLVITNSTNAP